MARKTKISVSSNAAIIHVNDEQMRVQVKVKSGSTSVVGKLNIDGSNWQEYGIISGLTASSVYIIDLVGLMKGDVVKLENLDNDFGCYIWSFN